MNDGDGDIGYVARILSKRELILNIGSKDGVQVGDVYRIVADEPTPVMDPKTDVKIGEFRPTKAVVRVSEISDQVSLARTFRERRVNVGGAGVAIGLNLKRLTEPPKFEYVIETLDANKIPGVATSKVQEGDQVLRIPADQVDDPTEFSLD